MDKNQSIYELFYRSIALEYLNTDQKRAWLDQKTLIDLEKH
jgi:hypothetical protein